MAGKPIKPLQNSHIYVILTVSTGKGSDSMKQEKRMRLGVNLLIMRTLWKAYFHHVKSEGDERTDFYKFIGVGSTMVSQIINMYEGKQLKKSVIDSFADKTSMSRNILNGEHLIKIGGRLEELFRKYGYNEEEGWQTYVSDENEEFNKLVREVLYGELKEQKSRGFEDDELRKQLNYMRSVKGVIHVVESEISKVTLEVLAVCTPKELEHYRSILEEEYRLATAVLTIRKSKKIASEGGIKIKSGDVGDTDQGS